MLENLLLPVRGRLTILLLVLCAWVAPATQAAAAANPLRFGVISTAEPARVYAEWRPFADYLAARLGRPVDIVIPRGFEKIQEAVENKSVDFYYINSFMHYRLLHKGQSAPIAQMMNLNGNITSKSIVFVRTDSGVSKLDQLKGEKVAFVSRMGAGGYLAPRAKFYDEGVDVVKESQEVFTQNLTSSIHKVLLGDVKAGAMCGLNYKLMSEKLDTGELKIISTSDDYVEDQIGARPDLDPALRKQIAEVIVRMHADAEGRKVLAAMRELKVQRFVPYDPVADKITEKLIKESKL